MHYVVTSTAKTDSRRKEQSQGTIKHTVPLQPPAHHHRSIIEIIQLVDGFRYTERSAQNREGGDGARLKYVCQDSVQNRTRKKHMKKENIHETVNGDIELSETVQLTGYECGGAIHIKFSIKREAIHVVYKHNPIHSQPADDTTLHALPSGNPTDLQAPVVVTAEEPKKRRRQSTKKQQVQVYDGDLDMSTSPEAQKAPAKRKRKNAADAAIPSSKTKPPSKKSKILKGSLSPAESRKHVPIQESPPPLNPTKGKACIRCREKRIQCNAAKPTCNQCKRGLWTCQYEVPGGTKRSKNGCLNCKQRRRKCTEEKPSCAYCIKQDDDCEYAEYS